MKTFKYNKEQYRFVELIWQLFGYWNLDELHTKWETEYELFDKPSKDSDTIYHKIFYDRMRNGWEEFLHVYKSFIKNFIQEKVGEPIIYQKWPTFRVHLPNNLAVGAWHTDSDYNHPNGEINFVIPITKMFESNTFITESEPGLKDFEQIQLDPGEVFMFNGNKCLHGNLPNRTGKTRISLDFRVLREKYYNPKITKSSITTNTKFTIGNYYERPNDR
tara:strand:- start:3132 stop:3785 length:654 start_codon:yes stop_codon:yes gene_type:complete